MLIEGDAVKLFCSFFILVMWFSSQASAQSTAKTIIGNWSGTYTCAGGGTGMMEVVTGIQNDVLHVGFGYQWGSSRGAFLMSGRTQGEQGAVSLSNFEWRMRPPGHQALGVLVQYISESDGLQLKFTNSCSATVLPRVERLAIFTKLHELIPSSKGPQHANQHSQSNDPTAPSTGVLSPNLDYDPAGLSEDVFLGEYDGIYRCGAPGGQFLNSIVSVKIARSERRGIRGANLFGRIKFTDPSTNALLFKQPIRAQGSTERLKEVIFSYEGTRSVYSDLSRRIVDFADVNFRFRLRFWNTYDSLSLVPERGGLGNKTTCRATKLKRIDGPPVEDILIPHPIAPEVTQICKNTATPEGAAQCILAAQAAEEKHGLRVRSTAAFQIVKRAYSARPPSCKRIKKDFDILLKNITSVYGVPFKVDTGSCRKMFDVLAELGYEYPQPDVCRRMTSYLDIKACLVELTSQRVTVRVPSQMRSAAMACRGEDPGVLTPFFKTIQSIQSFDGLASSDSRLMKLFDCENVLDLAVDVGAISLKEVDRIVLAAKNARIAQCSQERIQSGPSKLEIIEALSREVSRRCTAKTVFLDWISGNGSENIILNLAIHDFKPTGRTCEAHSRLTFQDISPISIYSVGAFDGHQCSSVENGMTNCSGRVKISFSTNDMRPSAARVNRLLDRYGRINATLKFDTNACDWEVNSVAPN